MSDKKITEEMVSNWVGNHGYGEKRDNFMIETLKEIASGEYSAEQLKNDIAHYDDQ
jgi:hypothetical protein